MGRGRRTGRAGPRARCRRAPRGSAKRARAGGSRRHPRHERTEPTPPFRRGSRGTRARFDEKLGSFFGRCRAAFEHFESSPREAPREFASVGRRRPLIFAPREHERRRLDAWHARDDRARILERAQRRERAPALGRRVESVEVPLDHVGRHGAARPSTVIAEIPLERRPPAKLLERDTPEKRCRREPRQRSCPLALPRVRLTAGATSTR